VRKRRIGLVLLTVWSGLNLVLAVVIVVAVGLFGRHAPALSLVFGDAEIRAIEPRVLGVVDALAILGNGCIAGFCGLVLAIVWRGVARGAGWAWTALAVTAGGVQAVGFLSDARLGHRDLAPNIVSTLLLAAGLALTRNAEAKK
jgi:hypothetical protein